MQNDRIKNILIRMNEKGVLKGDSLFPGITKLWDETRRKHTSFTGSAEDLKSGLGAFLGNGHDDVIEGYIQARTDARLNLRDFIDALPSEVGYKVELYGEMAVKARRLAQEKRGAPGDSRDLKESTEQVLLKVENSARQINPELQDHKYDVWFDLGRKFMEIEGSRGNVLMEVNPGQRV